MTDALASEQLAQRAVVAVDEGVVGEQPLRLDAVGGVEGEPALDEGGDRRCSLVAVELAVGEPRVVVDERVHPFVADACALVGAGGASVAGDGVAGAAEAHEPLAVDVEQVTGAWPFVAPRLLARLPRRGCPTS